MKKYMMIISIWAFSSISSAALYPPAGIDDTVQQIAWMQDANLVKTACSAAGPSAEKDLWDAFDALLPLSGVVRTGFIICGNDGELTWAEAEAWIGVLNNENYLGYNTWRQPVTPDLADDPTCQANGFVYYKCVGSELGHLFYESAPAGLGNHDVLEFFTFTPPIGTPLDIYFCGSGNCFTNTGEFTNTENGLYWSGSAPSASSAWSYDTSFGRQKIVTTTGIGFETGFVWPVRPSVFGDCDGTPGINIQDVICMINKVLAQ